MHAHFAVISRQSSRHVLAFLRWTRVYENALAGQQEGTNPLRVTLDTNNIPTHSPSVCLVAAENSMAALLYSSRMCNPLLLPALRVVKTISWKIWRPPVIGGYDSVRLGVWHSMVEMEKQQSSAFWQWRHGLGKADITALAGQCRRRERL